MTLRKDDISLLDKLSSQKGEKQKLSTDNVVLYKSILEHSASWSVDFEKTKEESFDSILDQIDLDKISTRNSNGFGFLKIAASLAILVVSIFLTYKFFDTNSISAELAEIKTVYLPDSSKVVLNAVSTITYSTSDWNKGNRIMRLDGHAYFEVKKGSQFQVESNHGTVSVLGTSFNIYDRAAEYKVECFTGKVSVETESKSKFFLTRGLKTELAKNKNTELLKPIEFDVSRNKTWTDGIFNFYNEPIKNVFAELERQFGIEIEYSGEENKYYTGIFNKSSLDKSLINICKPMGYEYELKENIILIINN